VLWLLLLINSESGLGGWAGAKAVRALDVLTLGLDRRVLCLNLRLLRVSELVRTESIPIDVTVVLVTKQ